MRWFYDATAAKTDEPSRLPTDSGSSNTVRLEDAIVETLNEVSISTMAEEFGVTMRTLRFYEEKGLLQPRRIGNRRFYDDACRARLRLVLKGKAMGLGLDDISDLVTSVEGNEDELDRADAVRALCMRQRDMLLERRATLDEQISETNAVIASLQNIHS